LKIVKWGLGAFGLAAVVGIVAVSAGLFGSVAQAQEPEADKGARHAAFQEKVAANLGITVAELEAAQKAARDEMIDEALAAGRITTEQAEKLKSRELGALRQGRIERVKGAAVNVFETAAQILGLSGEELRAGLQEGNSLNELAAEQGVSNLEAQMVAQITADIQAKAASGEITQEQADRLLEHVPEMVSRLIDREGGKPGEGLRGRFGPGGPRMAPAFEN
jgi:hypothetical protein